MFLSQGGEGGMEMEHEQNICSLPSTLSLSFPPEVVGLFMFTTAVAFKVDLGMNDPDTCHGKAFQ